MKNIVFIYISILCSFFVACKKDTFITTPQARLSTSVDSVKFDTVFTTVGSITKSFKIFNNNDQKLLISKITLAGGATSSFKINVNGIAAAEVSNIVVAPKDSIYIFVTVTVNQNVANLPFVISDSILVNYNGNAAKVNLEAYGQNANFIRNGLILGTVNFTNTLPYVILEGLQIASTGVLNINAGTKIYCHANAPIIVDGTLICTGTKLQPIIFLGDRLDEPYSGFPASWPGIYFRNTSKNNVLQFTNIQNAYQALVVNAASTNANAKLILKQCVVNNALDAGLLFTNTSAVVENCLVSNCGRGLDASFGGSYSFTNCTFANYSNNYIPHKKPTVFVTDANSNNQTNSLNALLQNCIIYGDAGFVQNEIIATKIGAAFTVNLSHSLYRASSAEPANTTITASIKNIDPSFDSVDNSRRIYNFRITKNPQAPGLNKGLVTSLLVDLEGKNRNVGLPDIGAYEKP